jgi:hypothetical protein
MHQCKLLKLYFLKQIIQTCSKINSIKIRKCILSGGKPASLKEIIKHNDLPLDVQFAGSGDQSMVDIGGSERTSSRLYKHFPKLIPLKFVMAVYL